MLSLVRRHLRLKRQVLARHRRHAVTHQGPERNCLWPVDWNLKLSFSSSFVPFVSFLASRAKKALLSLRQYLRQICSSCLRAISVPLLIFACETGRVPQVRGKLQSSMLFILKCCFERWNDGGKKFSDERCGRPLKFPKSQNKISNLTHKGLRCFPSNGVGIH